MEQFWNIARKSADQVEIYSRAVSTDGVNFENGKLKDIDSKLLYGVSLRMFKAGKSARPTPKTCLTARRSSGMRWSP